MEKTVYCNLIDSLRGADIKSAISKTNTVLASVDNAAFKVAIITAYATGITIPAYADDVAELTIDKKVSLRDFGKLIGRDHSTLSRWLKALTLIIDNGDFGYFVSGTLKFQFDKLILIYENKDVFLVDYTLTDLLSMSYSTLKSLLPQADKTDDKTIEVNINGTIYLVSEKLFNSFIDRCKAK